MTGADDTPTRSLEVELKLDVDAGTPLPDFTGLPGVASVTSGEPRSLDTRYLDTADGLLARSGIALRHRVGGPDAGWHIKGPLVDGARVELHWEPADATPPAALRELARLTDVAPADLSALAPLALIRNERVAYHLLDAAGGAIAEFVDDHVHATDERAHVERSWREWELELDDAAPAGSAEREAFFAAAVAAAIAVGARHAASASKLARALGH